MENQEKKESIKDSQNMRQIIIETDGNNIRIAKTEAAGSIELIGILKTLLDALVNKG